mgnify:CR=1 FL=1
MTVGVIFLSLGATPELREMTQNAINSCITSDPDINFMVLVCESTPDVTYTGALVTYPPPDQPFNYNGYMNTCRACGVFEGCEYIALCNNDLLFEKGWATNLIKKMKEKDVLSACPMEPVIHKEVVFEDGVHAGHEVTSGYRPIAGWCIFQDLRIYDIIKDLDTRAEFWHADTMYGVQLQGHKINHILVEDSKVHHLCSKTLFNPVISEPLRHHYTNGSPIHKQICGL